MVDIIKVRALNDEFRRTLRGGRVVLTPRVAALSEELRMFALHKVQTYEDWSGPNEREHDVGIFMVEEDTYFWKIDYYALDMEHGSEDASDPALTVQIGRAHV